MYSSNFPLATCWTINENHLRKLQLSGYSKQLNDNTYVRHTVFYSYLTSLFWSQTESRDNI